MLWRGSQILNLGHVTLTTPTLGVICYPVANTCYGAYVCQIDKYEVSMLNRTIDIEGVPKYPYLMTKFALRIRGIT